MIDPQIYMDMKNGHYAAAIKVLATPGFYNQLGHESSMWTRGNTAFVSRGGASYSP